MVRSNLARQSGMALLFALLLVVVAVTISVSISHEVWFSIRKTAHRQLNAKAEMYAVGLEDWARIFLQKDSKDSKIDHLQEDWAIGIPGLPIEGGYIAGFLEDEQAKFNINNLPNSEVSLNRFKRLCDNLEVNTDFIPALQYWIDEDLDVRYPDGSEDHYENYRVANQPIADISELLLIKGVTPEMFQKLKPHITALPTTTNINVNTMSGTMFLAILPDDVSTDEETFLKEREESEFKDVNDFMTRLTLNIPEEGLRVSTDYFVANGQVVQGEQNFTLKTLIYRTTAGATTVINRTLGQF